METKKTAKFEVEVLVEKAEKSVANLSKNFESLWGKGHMPKTLQGDLEKLVAQLASIRGLGHDGLIDTDELKQADSDTKNYSKTLRHLSTNLRLLSEEEKKALLDDKTLETFKARTEAVKEYEKEIEKAQKNQKKLNELKSKQDKAQKELDSLATPEMSDELKKMQEYKKLLGEIQKSEEQIAKLRSRGISENSGKENDLTRALKYKEELQTKVSNLNLSDEQKSTASTQLEAYERSVQETADRAEELRKSLKDLSAQINNMGTSQSTVNLAQLKQELKNLGVEGIDAATNLQEVKIALNSLEQSAIQGVDDQIKELLSSINSMANENDKMRDAVSGATESLKQQNQALAEQQAFENRIKQFLGLTGAVQLLRSAARAAMRTIAELDETMTEMSVVTSLDIGDYWDQLPEYTARANELGLAINSVYKADTLFYQQGLKTKEVIELSTEAMKMARIAGIDTAEATNKMTAALRGFNMELNEASAQRISDVYSELAAITAASTLEIANAMTKTASIASSAGMEFETTAAFLSQIIETTRESAETAGTAMKTIIARFQELKKAPSEIGEVEGEVIDANAIETALRTVGVSLRDASGQFRNLDQVFLELSQKWDDLDKNTQRYIATIAAGSRQQSRFIAMMSDYSRTQELVEAANNSAGASNQQFEKTLDSLESKMTNLKNAWSAFTMGILNSDLVKIGVTILTKFLEIVNKATDAFDGLGGSISKIASVLVIFEMGKKIFDKLKAPLADFFADIIKRAATTGEQAGRAAIEGVNRAKQDAQKPSGGNGFNKKFSFGNIRDTWRAGGYARLTDRNEALLGKATKMEDKLKTLDKESKQYKKLSEQYNKTLAQLDKRADETSKKLAKLSEEQRRLLNEGKAGYASLGENIQKMGQCAVSAGVGISMLGGLLSSFSPELEGVGNAISKAGSAMIVLGTVTTAFGGISDKLTKKLVKNSMTAAAAWWWVVAIVAAVSALVVAVIGIAKAVENASPEKKLEKARSAAEAAGEAADKMKQEYEDLKKTLDDIGNSQTVLSKLTRGTDAWKESVKALNNEMLQLIQEYPELAKFVQHNNGVMTLDLESEEVQQALQDAEEKMLNSQLMATGAEVLVLQAQDALSYANLDSKAKLGYIDPEAAAGWAYAGAIGAGAGAGAAGGAAVGSAATPIGTAAGTLLGGTIGALTAEFSGAADAASEEARKAAESYNAKSQLKVEDLAKALTSGHLIDSGSGYELHGVSEQEFRDKYGNIQISEFDELYSQLGSSTEALREFGSQLNATSEQAKAYYASMATQIYNQIDKSGWSKNTHAVADNLLDDTALETRVNAIRTELAGVDFTEKDFLENNPEMANRLTQALSDTYGAGSRMVEDTENGGYKIINSKGDTVLSNADATSLRNIVATSEAKKQTQAVGEQMPQVTETLIREFQKVLPNATQEAIVAAFDSEGGEALTQEYLSQLQGVSAEQLSAMFNNSDLLKKVFGTGTEFINTYFNAIENGSLANEKANSFLENTRLSGSLSSISSGALGGLTNESHLGLVYQRGNLSEISAFEESFNKVISQGDQQAIVERMNAISDWTDQEQLIAFQYDLINQYGIEEKAASALATSMSKAVNAVSSLSNVIEPFGEFYQASQKVNGALQKVVELEWDYQRELYRGADATKLANNLEEQRQLIYQAGQEALNGYNAALEDQARVFAKGVNLIPGVDISSMVTYDDKNKTYDVSQLNEFMKQYEEGTEERKAIEQYVQEITEANTLTQEQLSVSKEQLNKLDELNETSRAAYYNLYDRVGELLTTEMQKSIDIEEELLEATEEANDKLISKIQEQIDTDRQVRENEEAESSLGNLRDRLAYLSADTSGNNGLELLDLQKQIAEEEQNYTDSLIDQSLQSMQDANEKAQEQRERQIELAEQQLAIYQNSKDFSEEVYRLLESYYAEFDATQREGREFEAEKTELGGRIIAAGLLDGLNELDKENYWRSISENTAKSADYANGKLEEGSDTEELLSAIDSNTATQVERLVSAQLYTTEQAKYEKFAADNASKGFSYTTPSLLDSSGKVNANAGASFATRNNAAQQVMQIYNDDNNATDARLNILNHYRKWAGLGDAITKDQYYANNFDKFVSSAVRGETFDTYGTFMNSQLNAATNLKNWLNSDDWKGKTRSSLAQDAKAIWGDSFDEKLRDFVKIKVDRLLRGGNTIEGENKDLHNYLIDTGLVDVYSVLDHGKIKLGIKDNQWVLQKRSVPNGLWNSEKADVEGINPEDLPQDLYERLTSSEEIKRRGTGAIYEYDGNYYSQANVGGKMVLVKINDLGRGYYSSQSYYYKSGGLADFTGPAWLDGTPSRPEYVLNAAQTERFFSLVDVLEGINKDKISGKASGDNYFDIEINVDKLENDYDVEQIANKIRRMIYEDATYRNVNAINHIR